MNNVVLSGRLTKDPDIRMTTGENPTTVARFNLAVDRLVKNGAQDADFPGVVTFGKTAEFAEKYLSKGTKIILRGRIQTGSYTNKEGQKVYTTDVVAENIEFAESKKNADNGQAAAGAATAADDDGFLNIPDGVGEELPFA